MRSAVLCAAVVISSCGFVFGQAQEKVLYRFGGSPDGSRPLGKIVLDSAGNLYGTTERGGSQGWGTVFELAPGPGGTWIESVLYSFCQDFDGLSCLDGAFPEAGLTIDAAGNLYGTTSTGGGFCFFGSEGCGTVFELSPPVARGGAWHHTVLYKFCQPGDESCSDGAAPYGKLVFDSSGNLYGTTAQGGANKVGGTIFELSPTPTGWIESVLYSFCPSGKFPVCPDGWQPRSAVAFDKRGNIYGTTLLGGSPRFEGGGVVYRLSPSPIGWEQMVLYAFPSTGGKRGGYLLAGVNFDSSGNLYGAAFQGSQFGLGNIYRLSPKNGGSESTLSFDGTNGANPAAGVLVDPRNGDLYGTTSEGGYDHLGTVFRVHGKTLSVLHYFQGDTDGAFPMAALEADSTGCLYGTTEFGGFNNGTIFQITP